MGMGRITTNRFPYKYAYKGRLQVAGYKYQVIVDEMKRSKGFQLLSDQRE
jgi:hypothetical protein